MKQPHFYHQRFEKGKRRIENHGNTQGTATGYGTD